MQERKLLIAPRNNFIIITSVSALFPAKTGVLAYLRNTILQWRISYFTTILPVMDVWIEQW